MVDTGEDKPTLLIVEDDEQLALLMQFIFEQDGFLVRRAANLAAARELLLALPPPALVSLDIMLPDGSGVDLILQIRDTPGWERVPIIMVTSKEKEKEANWAIKAGSRAYIVKPFKPEELRATVARLVKKKPAA